MRLVQAKRAKDINFFMFNKRKIALVSWWCDKHMNDVVLIGIMPGENTRCSRLLSSIFPVEMAS